MNSRQLSGKFAIVMTGALLGACGTTPREALTSCQQLQVVPPLAKTDILFVVDDSNSMAENQQTLAAAFDEFVAQLANSAVENDFQIGVTTTSIYRYVGGYLSTFEKDDDTTPCQNLDYLGTNTSYPAGALVSVVGSTIGPSKDSTKDRIQRFTASITSPPRILVTGSATLSDDFKMNVNVGVCGSRKEQGFEAAREAIEKSVPGGINEGFLRPGARLAVIIVSDADDCSDPAYDIETAEARQRNITEDQLNCTSYPVSKYVSYFKGPIAGENRDVVIGTIVAADQNGQVTSCAETSTSSSSHQKYTPVRYQEFVAAFGVNAVLGNVCDQSFVATLTNIAGLIDPGQKMPLSGTPADRRLLTVGIHKNNGSSVSCQVGAEGDASANVHYQPPTESEPASLTFSGTCKLERGDKAEVQILCAG